MAITDEAKRLEKLKTFEMDNRGLNYWYHQAREEIQKLEGTYKPEYYWLHGKPPVG